MCMYRMRESKREGQRERGGVQHGVVKDAAQISEEVARRGITPPL